MKGDAGPPAGQEQPSNGEQAEEEEEEEYMDEAGTIFRCYLLL